MRGYGGSILHVDLATGSVRPEPLAPDVARAYLGGNGLAVRLLYDRVPAGLDPLAPGSRVVFAVGPVTDTPVPGSSRACVGFKSPLTGGYFDATFGGRFAQTLKRTGFDAVAIAGRADRPVYLVVEPGGARVLPAEDLWGATTTRAARVLRERHGPRSDVAVIGPAGEAGVRFACLAHLWNGKASFAGRGGVGAVLGAKRVKAVVVRGDDRVRPADEAGLAALARRRRDDLRVGTEPLTRFGTAFLVEPINAFGGLGVRNLQRETCDRAGDLSGETYRDRFHVKDTSCARCPVACGKVSRVEDGLYAPLRAKTPEYESLFALGTMVEVYDPAAVLEANRLCDDLGLDTISMGVTAAFACECVERGVLGEDEIGFPLGFGRADGLLEAIRRTAARSGFGARLAEGSVRLAASLGDGAHRYLYATKGLEIAAHSARALEGMGLGYATATRGGSHHDTRPTLRYGPGLDDLDPDQQAAWAVRSQHFTAVGDALVQCRLVAERGFGRELGDDYAEMVRCATGWDADVPELERVGERIYNLERVFNVREGFRRQEDVLPHRVLHEPVPDGPRKGRRCPPEELDTQLDAYYRLRGWTPDGVPSRARLDALGLGPEAADIGSR